MIENGFIEDVKKHVKQSEGDYGDATVKDLNLPGISIFKFHWNSKDAVTVSPNTSCEAVLDIMKKGGFDQVPIVDDHKKLVGLITTGRLLSHISKGKCKFSDPVSHGKIVKVS